MTKLDQAYPPHQIIRLVLDNQSAHISKETKTYLATGLRGQLYTPTHGSANLTKTQQKTRTRAGNGASKRNGDRPRHGRRGRKKKRKEKTSTRNSGTSTSTRNVNTVGGSLAHRCSTTPYGSTRSRTAKPSKDPHGVRWVLNSKWQEVKNFPGNSFRLYAKPLQPSPGFIAKRKH